MSNSNAWQSLSRYINLIRLKAEYLNVWPIEDRVNKEFINQITTDISKALKDMELEISRIDLILQQNKLNGCDYVLLTSEERNLMKQAI